MDGGWLARRVREEVEEKIAEQNYSVSGKPKIEIYGSEHCGYCTAAKLLFKRKGIEYEDIRISKDDDAVNAMMARSGSRSVPQIFINDRSIGGFDELYALAQSGDLDQLLGVKRQ